MNVHRGNVMFINNEILKKAGVETVPQDGPGFLQVCEKIKQAGFIPLALGDKDKWEAAHLFETVLLSALGPEGYNGLWNGTTSFNDPGIGRAIVIFEELIKYVNEDHAALTWQDATKMVFDGKAAFNVMGDWAKYLTTLAGLRVDRLEASRNSALLVVQIPSSPKNAPNRENALKSRNSGLGRWDRTLHRIRVDSARLDADKSLYDPYLTWSMNDFATNALCPSIAHGSAAPEGFITELNDAVNIFITTKDRDGFLKAIRNAAEDYID